MSRKKNSIYNLFWGIAGNIITTIIAILIPRLFILNYGSEINGLLASVRQIYVYLALLEAGVGEASIVALYGPIAKNDRESINSILAATDYYYKKIGCIYLLGVIGLGMVYPLFLNTDISYHISCSIIILQGMGGVINYLFQGKYNMLLRVDNRNYVTTNLGTITSILIDGCRIVLLLSGHSIIAVQATYLFFNIVKMIYVSWYMKRNYKWIDLNVSPNFKAISQKNSVIIHQISALIFGNTDVLILTFVCGLKTVSIYTMYASFFSMVNNIITIIANSVSSALGQVFNSDREKYKDIQETYETYYLALVFILFTITVIFILPFLKLYTAGADINYIDFKLPWLFVIYQLLNYGRNSSAQIIGFAGHYKQTQIKAVIEAVINLAVSFASVFRWGIYGVLIGTIIALLFRANDMILYANMKIMKRSPWPTYRRWLICFGIFLVCVMVFMNLPLTIVSYSSLIKYAIIESVIICILFFGILSIVERDARKVAISYIEPIMSNLWKKIHDRTSVSK